MFKRRFYDIGDNDHYSHNNNDDDRIRVLSILVPANRVLGFSVRVERLQRMPGMRWYATAMHPQQN